MSKGPPKFDGKSAGQPRRTRPAPKPPLRLMTTTLWEYPSQHYDAYLDEKGNIIKSVVKEAPGGRGMQGDKDYAGATPSWVIWQVLRRYTRESDTVVDPMCGSGTTLDVCTDLKRTGIGFDLAPSRPEIRHADARTIPLEKASADFVFIDPPYSTHIDYSDDPRCIGKLDAAPDSEDGGKAYHESMARVIAEIDRILKPRRYMALYVSDSWRKRRGEPGAGGGIFMPIGFDLFALMQKRFRPVDIISVVRHNQKLGRGNWHKAAEEGNFFLRGFNYLFIMKKI